MATIKKISKQKLNTVIKGLPAPVQKHCKRTKMLAAYIVEQIKTEEWFLDTEFKPNFVVDAVFYHDIGKCKIAEDCLYSDHCTSQEKRKTYESHVFQGVPLIVEECGAYIAESPIHSFEYCTYLAITEHHEHVDGNGFPYGKRGEDLSIVGKITALANELDHLLFVGRTDWCDFDGAMVELEKLSGTVLDETLVGILLDCKEAFREFVSYLFDSEIRNIKKNSYGIRVFYHPVVSLKQKETVMYRAEYRLNDPYYGMIGGEAVLPIAEQSGQIFKLERLAFEKMCSEIDRLCWPDDMLPMFTFGFSAVHVQKPSFVRDVTEVLRAYEINPKLVCISVKDTEMQNLEYSWTETVDALRELGVSFMIDEFSGVSPLLSAMDELTVDRICMKKSYSKKITFNSKTQSIVEGLIQIAKKLNIEIVFDAVEKDETVSVLRQMDVPLASGPLYGQPLSYKELRKLMDDQYIKGGDGQ